MATHIMPSAQVLGFSTDHLDKDDKEAEGSGVVEATRFLPEVGNTDDHVYETSCSPRQNLRLSFHLA